MAIHGLGVDILHAPRIASIIQRRSADSLAARILSPAELEAFRKLSAASVDVDSGTVRFLGVRWAVKEAAYKALHPLRPTWKELTYTSFDRHTDTRPSLVFFPSTVDAGSCVGGLHVSVSHDGEYIVATVLVEKKEC